ncbi:MAG: glycosyltransferase [Bacteroidales bacterium]|nr:glycosyltransferase [Bacteroidales bacterium]
MTTVSIIVPIFNVAEYLPDCLESVGRQMQSDWELILVNDGSTDGSLDICKEFAVGKTNVRVIDSSHNGISEARNAGTAAASGKWICYLDGDDWLAEDAVATLLDFAIANECDVVQGGFFYAYEDRLLYDSRTPDKVVLENMEAMRELVINDRIKNFAWGKLYRASLVKEVKFPEGCFFEDVYWQHLVIHRIRRYGIVSKPLYYYRQRESGISGKFSGRNLFLAKGCEERLSFIQKNYPDLEGLMTNNLWNTIFTLVHRGRADSDKEIRLEYEKYYDYALSQYSGVFGEYLKKNLTWRLRNCPAALCIVLLAKRAWGRLLKPNCYKSITVNK